MGHETNIGCPRPQNNNMLLCSPDGQPGKICEADGVQWPLSERQRGAERWALPLVSVVLGEGVIYYDILKKGGVV